MAFAARRLALLLLLGGALVPVAPFAHAQDAPRRYAVLSVIGDGLTLIMERSVTGSIVDPNLRSQVPIGDSVFDDATVLAAEAAIKREAPQAPPPSLLGASGAAAYGEVRQGIRDDGFSPPKWLDDALKADRSTHLLLITKHRAQASFLFVNEKIGVGMVEGLGFYVNRYTRSVSQQTGAHSLGFMAPFAYFQVRLVDLANGKSIGRHLATASEIYGSADSSDGLNAWNALTDAGKIERLKQLIARELDTALPVLMRRR